MQSEPAPAPEREHDFVFPEDCTAELNALCDERRDADIAAIDAEER